MSSVSYTHLDVYKRQIGINFTTSMFRWLYGIKIPNQKIRAQPHPAGMRITSIRTKDEIILPYKATGYLSILNWSRP